MSEIHPRLYLITPPVSDVDAFAPKLEAAFKGGRIDSVLLRIASSDEREVKRIVQALVPVVQQQGAAVLIEPTADLRLAARAGADGIHIRYSEAALDEALEAQKPDRIVGVQGLKTRDAAMSAGEAGADYLMFGEPYPDGVLPDFAGVLDRVSWWTETFLTPCVAYAPTLADVTALAEARAEFIALEDAVWNAPEGPEAAVNAALEAIAKTLAV
ncbi:MAG: thiamine phosphate synthase [Beijerinckiaceae bacterium]|nr:thiamine phosphate synthase [Beijerinckiaceae bacterium]